MKEMIQGFANLLGTDVETAWFYSIMTVLAVAMIVGG